MYDTVPFTVNADAAQAWFVAGTIVLMSAGGLHVLATLLDTLRPTFFTPVESSAKAAVEGTGVRFWRLFGSGGGTTRSMWKAWLGFNISHGLGVVTVGLLCLLIATHDFQLVERIDAIRPLTIAFSGALLVVALRFWFYIPAIIAGSATACFMVATVLSS